MIRRLKKALLASYLLFVGFLSSCNALQAQDMRVMQLAKLEIDPAQLENYRGLLREGVETARKLEPGVLMLYPVVDKNRPNLITILEIYADSTAYRAHLRSPHFLKYKTATASMVKHLELTPVTALIPEMTIK